MHAAREAGAIALRYFGKSPEAWEKDDGAGPVSEADLAVNAALEEMLGQARREYGWLSEETADGPERLERESAFIVDPIDGTRAFLKGTQDWSISLAIAERGEVRDAVIFLPAKNLMFRASKGHGAFLNDAPLATSARTDIDGAHLVGAKAMLQPQHWRDDTPPQLNHHFRSSLAYRMGLVSDGRYDAMMSLRPTWEWDVAAGHLMIEEAGGRVSDKHGNRAVFNQPDPRIPGMIGAGHALHPQIVARLK